jgi:hypothetical protein
LSHAAASLSIQNTNAIEGKGKGKEKGEKKK